MWYEKYLNFPYKLFGIDEKGIDCFNLVRLIYIRELQIVIPYSTKDLGIRNNENWYNNSSINYFGLANNPNFGWKKVESPKVYDMVIMTYGSTNVPNHCGMFVENNKIIHTMMNHVSHTSVYGTYFKNYTEGFYRYNAI